MKADTTAKKTILAIVIVGALCALLASTKSVWLYPFYGVVPADLARLNVVGAPNDVAAQLQDPEVGPGLVVGRFRRGSAGTFETVSLDWSTAQNVAPRSIMLHSSGAPSPEVAARLGKILHGGFASSTWSFGNVTISMYADASTTGGGSPGLVTAAIDPQNNSLFARQSAVALHVLDAAAFGDPLNVSDDEMRAVFGGGYPVADLAKLDVRTKVADARARVAALFPGAWAIEDRAFRVGVDHPVVAFATLEWNHPNDAEGSLKLVVLSYAAGASDKREPWTACLAKSLGMPATNALVSTWQLGPPSSDASLSVGEDGATLHTQDLPVDKFAAIVSAIDHCR